ncbi:SDR family NAD(P)-dependent oxidoreductase [Curtobacterium sp. VKM Ac-2922]|uniref:SDR family NAD(P)-dependent oxidoreductase n=1 Tax=Curtobacterium sp. VKM Ac-2922 TaxID=2929475 RepID=UPI001FB451E5|nr:SDR family NAD(P)-dependent oxidoreductase [Curtobacterium sp. VKM Ac-2922]MCJ1713905.1 SDR family NAD(P)-dependent oxidoreductase [Curtobacterium sp. VKM Ac-2922]
MSTDTTAAAGGGRAQTVVVTGASAGLGYHAAEQLAAAGHRVVLATRNPERADAAERSIRQHVPDATLEHLHVDLADLDSVRAAAADLQDRGPVDVLLNNAGVVGSRTERFTAQGVELQVGTNHVGHFAFTGLLLPMLERSGGRVVHLGSIAHRWASLDRRDPLRVGHYSGYRQYGRSKLAVMLFGFELAERLADAGSAVSSVVAHPGLAFDALGAQRPLVTPARDEPAWMRPGERAVAQGKDAGALPLVHAAVGADVRSGEYWGPGGPLQLRGSAAIVRAEPRAHDRTVAARLWLASEQASGVAFALDAFA